jgi:hypothetical protein
MHWLFIHLELLLPLSVAAVVMLFEVIQKFRQKEALPLRAYLAVTLLLLAGIGITMIAQDRPEISHLGAHLKADYADGNSYVEEMIDHILYHLKGSMEKRGFETESLDSTLRELLRAIPRCQRGDSILAIDYGIPWGAEFKAYGTANLNAAERGVAITRVFIVPDVIINVQADADGLWRAMKEQSLKGIKVKFVREAQLTPLQTYQDNAKGMVEFKFGGKSLLMVEAVPYWEAMRLNVPPKLDVKWDADAIRDVERYFSWLTGQADVKDINPQGPRPF